MENPNLFDAFAQRDEALARADEHANDIWKQTVERVIMHLARMRPAFSADDVWAYLAAHHDVGTHEPRALGAVIKKLVAAGKIRATGDFTPSLRRHAAPIRLWTAA